MKNIIYGGTLVRILPLSLGQSPSWYALTFEVHNRRRVFFVNWRQYSRVQCGKKYIFSARGLHILRIVETDAPGMPLPLGLFLLRLAFAPLPFPELADAIYTAYEFSDLVSTHELAELLIYASDGDDEIDPDSNDTQVALAEVYCEALRTLGTTGAADIVSAAIDRWSRAVENGALLSRDMDMFADLDVRFRAVQAFLPEQFATFIETHSEEIYARFPETDIRI